MNSELTPRARPHVQARTVAGEQHQALVFLVCLRSVSIHDLPSPQDQMNSLPPQTLEPTGQELTRWAMLRVVFEASHSSASPQRLISFF